MNSLSLSSLSPAKRALLEARLLQSKTSPSASGSSFDPTIPHPLSYSQESLWFLDRLEPDSALYNIPEAMRLRGPLHQTALRRALETIVSRHAALRTEFMVCDGKPMQIVRENRTLHLAIIDLSQFPSQEREAELRRQIDAEAKRPFHLSKDVLLRAALLKLAEEDHALLLTSHHIVSDLWSFGILHQELEILYDAFAAGKDSPLPGLRIQFPEIAAAQREHSGGTHWESQLNFWKETLRGELPFLELPTDKPRPSRQSFKGARKHFQFAPALREKLKELSRRQGATLYQTLLAAFATLLHRYTGQEDMVIGSPTSGRNSTEAETLIGYFINTLPIRLDLRSQPGFAQLLQRVRETVLQTFSHQETPLERIIEELQLPRVAGQNPLFQVVFQFVAAPVAPLKLPGLSSEFLPAETETAKFDLIATVVEDEAGLGGNIEYNTDLFAAPFIERMIGHFEILLNAIVENPGQPIGVLTILSSAERQKILVEWNDTTSHYPRHATIGELFELQARRSPSDIAVIGENVKLTYGDLNRRANQLAHHLREIGVREGSLVGFCVERSIEMVIGLLGILKAGAAYVTLDPQYPRERLAFMFEDITAAAFVTTEKFQPLAPASAPTVCLDRDAETISLQSNVNPSCTITPRHPAYVIYTSGSTGRPKGVVVPHRAVVRLVKETNYLRFTPEDVFLQFAPISFDASTLEIFGPLLNGGKLVLFPPRFDSLEQLGSVIQRHQVTTLWLTAGLFHQMIEHHIDGLRNVRWLLAGGDVLSVPHVLKALREMPNTQLINGYGPTENTTFTCCHPVRRDWEGGGSVPIGKPISQTQVYILDKRMQPAPIGVPGELFIGGDGLALEYLNAPELTAQKFVRVPGLENNPLYRTGDLVRWLADGNIEFLGRLDYQVKIRGFRVEPGEIENTCLQHPGVKEAIVVAREDRSATKHLAAYVVWKNNEPDLNGLKTFLEAKLPSHMVPSRIVSLDRLPLNANGKVDRQQLPDPLENHQALNSSAPPRNETEQALAVIWSEVLGFKTIGIEDNFFTVGGHSLLATRLVSRISKQFNVELPLRAIFESPTIAALAVVIGKLRQHPPSPENEPILRRSRPVAASISRGNDPIHPAIPQASRL